MQNVRVNFISVFLIEKQRFEGRGADPGARGGRAADAVPMCGAGEEEEEEEEGFHAGEARLPPRLAKATLRMKLQPGTRLGTAIPSTRILC